MVPGLSYMTRSVNGGRLINIAKSLHKLTLCWVYCSSCITFYPSDCLTVTTGLASCICIRIAYEKAHMHMQVQGHWACPYAHIHT